MPRLSTVVLPDIPDCYVPSPFHYACTTSISGSGGHGQQRHHQLPRPPCVSRLALPSAPRDYLAAECQQRSLRAGPLPWRCLQPHRGCPCVPSVTHGTAMLGGAGTRGHGHTGLGTIQRSPVWLNIVLTGIAWLSMDWHSLAGVAQPSISDTVWPGMSSSAQPCPRKEALYWHSFGARAEQDEPNGCYQPWNSLSFHGACLQLGRLCPYRLTAAAREPRPHRAPAFYLTPPCPRGQVLPKQGAGCTWGQEPCPLPEGRATQTFKTSCSMVLLLQAQRTSLVLSLYRGLCSRQLVLLVPTLVQRQPWGALLWAVARAASSFSQPDLPQAGSIKGSLHKGDIIQLCTELQAALCFQTARSL